MDELIRSCLREIAFDGDYGCDASRLKTFIEKFYTDNGNVQQTVDDGFNALVWSYIVQNPSVLVGFRPASVKQDVYIADSVDAARGKAKIRKRWVDQTNKPGKEADDPKLPPLECLPPSEVENSTLDELLQRYGKKLRIAVTPETCFRAITGMSMTPAKITPMTYTVLQLIARAREKGCTFVEICKATTYSPGTVFYLVKVLQEAGLVKKLATITNSGTQMAVHMHFFNNHPAWTKVHEEARRVEEQRDAEPSAVNAVSTVPATETGGETLAAETHEEGEADIRFEPMDDRHLSRPEIVLGRVIKLLEHSKNHSHRQHDMLVRIGMQRPSKVQRRYFSRIINVAIQQGILERLFVKSLTSKEAERMARILRLVPGQRKPLKLGDLEEKSGEAEANADAEEEELAESGKASLTGTRFLATMSLERNLVEVVNSAGPDGITHAGIIRELGLVEVRTLEMHLSKLAKKEHVLPHLSDLNISLLVENYGRERRLRIFTTRNFALFLAREKFENPIKDQPQEDARYSEGFMLTPASRFYKDEADLWEFIHSYKPRTFEKLPKAPRLLGHRTPKPKLHKNPIGPDGKPIKGRPRKYPPGESAISLERKRKLEEGIPVGRGRRPKKPRIDLLPPEEPDLQAPAVVEGSVSTPVLAEEGPKKRGRPRKNPWAAPGEPGDLTAEAADGPSNATGPFLGGVITSGRRGRKKRARPADDGTEEPPAKKPSTLAHSSKQEFPNMTPTPLPETPSHHLGEVAGDLISTTQEQPTTEFSSPQPGAPQANSPPATPTVQSRRRERAGENAAPKTNISNARRAQEIMECLRRNNGVLHAGLPLLQAHKKYQEELIASGERQKSLAGLMDKRTLVTAIDILLRNKEIKILTTDSGAWGRANRSLKLLYLPDTPPEVISRYRRSLEKEVRVFSLWPQEGPIGTMEYSEFKRERMRMLRDPPRPRERKSNNDSEGQANLRENSEGVKLLARKARQTREKLENDWQRLVAETVETLPPGTYDINAPGLNDVKRTWFIRAGGMLLDNARDRIIAAVTGTPMPAIKKITRRYFQPSREGQLRDVPHCSLCEKHLEIIQSLVDRQKEELEAKELQEAAATAEGDSRRSRYTWSPEYDELALDAEAVIRARCRPDQRPPIGLYERIFPRLRAHNIRGHLKKLRDERPGGVQYVKQLQAAWNAVRFQPHADVSDPVPNSLVHFPLEKHIAYLRAHVDKSKIGLGQAEPLLPTADDLIFALPKDLSYLEQHWDKLHTRTPATEWDFIWSVATDEMRGRNLHHEAFVLPSIPSAPHVDLEESTVRKRTETAVKMTVSPNEDVYNAAQAAEMLQLLGEGHVAEAFGNLKRRKVIKALERKPPSGRTMGISEAQFEAFHGPIDWRLYRDANLLERDLLQVEQEPWSVMASDGRTAGLLDLVSEGHVELVIDTSSCRALDLDPANGSREIQDDYLENDVYVTTINESLLDGAVERPPLVAESHKESPVALSKLTTLHAGEDIKCAVGRAGATNCSSCLDITFEELTCNMQEPIRTQLYQFRAELTTSQKNGLTVDDILDWCRQSGVDFEQLRQRIGDLARSAIPVFACVGYEIGRIVSSQFIGEWFLQTRRQPFDMVAPRRWLQPSGQRDDQIWYMSLRNVMGWILVRPGLSEAVLRERSSELFDRLEMNDLLQALSEAGYAVRKTTTGEATPELIGFSTLEEEATWHWHSGTVPWYHLR